MTIVSVTSATDALEKQFRQIMALGDVSSMLGWDTNVMMPDNAGDVRGNQLAELATVTHEKLADPRLADLFAAAAMESLDGWRAANLREMRSAYAHATAVPADLVAAIAKQSVISEQCWREARKESDFSRFLTEFKPMLALRQQEAAAKGAALGLSPYDAMLDGYDSGMRAAIIDPIFAQVKTWLPDLVEAAIAHQARQPAIIDAPPVPIDKQEALGRELMVSLGFDMTRGRIDVSTHPFCGGVPGDVRITTRYSTDDYSGSLFGVLHETGHALYEAGLPEAYRLQPVGRARGMSLHESQSLFVEMQLARSPAFLRYLAPKLRAQFGVDGAAWTPDAMQRSLTQVERSFIRVDADEVTYPLHIMLRYELEQALLSGDLAPEDLPGAWNEKMQHYLGITPPNDASGCLQDIHWSDGSIGYFPTYTLGAMTAAQLMASARKALPELDAQIERGEFAPIIGWLRENVHQHGSFYTTPELIAAATGEPLNPKFYENHLKLRYTPAA